MSLSDYAGYNCTFIAAYYPHSSITFIADLLGISPFQSNLAPAVKNKVESSKRYEIS